MGQTGYKNLTDAEKGGIFQGNDIHAFPLNDPDNAIDYCGMTGTLTLSQYIDVVNDTASTLYFKVTASILSGDSEEWDGLSGTIGAVDPSGTLTYAWEPTRTVPTSKTTESLRLNITAYSDSGYSTLFGEDNIDYWFYFFSHTDANATVVSFADFENTLDGWARSEADFGVLEANYPYTGAYSLKLGWVDLDDTYNGTTDSSGQMIPNQVYYISKTVNLSAYSSAFIVIHSTRQTEGLAEKSAPNVLRVWTATKDFIIRLNRSDDTTQAWRIGLPLTCGSETIKITGCFSAMNGGAHKNNWIDTILIVGFA